MGRLEQARIDQAGETSLDIPGRAAPSGARRDLQLHSRLLVALLKRHVAEGQHELVVDLGFDLDASSLSTRQAGEDDRIKLGMRASLVRGVVQRSSRAHQSGRMDAQEPIDGAQQDGGPIELYDCPGRALVPEPRPHRRIQALRAHTSTSAVR